MDFTTVKPYSWIKDRIAGSYLSISAIRFFRLRSTISSRESPRYGELLSA